MTELVPIKCPVCGAPIDRGAIKCKYCETSYYHDVHHNTPDDIDVLYADGTPIVAMYRGQVVSPEIETQLKKRYNNGKRGWQSVWRNNRAIYRSPFGFWENDLLKVFTMGV